ncbi:hypothetical protein ABDK56_06675 [Sphingomonas sp. ASV193]|uniref:hypothetical protein n=1 Tax=Sphingomonas sp. ASV193 TaxID=3144405 RepID=UPI0032E8A03A
MTVTSSPNRARWWAAAFVAATFGTAALKLAHVLTGPWSTALFLASFLLIIPMTREGQRALAVCGAASPAQVRYTRRFLIASLSYVALFFAAMSIARTFDPPLIARVLLALVAAVPVMGMIRAMALLLKEEDDEYLRARHVEQSLIATGFLLVLATLYGFLNAFDVAPRIDAWAAFPVWAIGLGVARLVRREPSC